MGDFATVMICAPNVRVQRTRAKGWRMPEFTRYCGRPGRWGNPFQGEDAVALYRRWLAGQMSAREFADRADGRYRFGDYRNINLNIRSLAGLDLCCWCALDKPCHVDVLLELANR